MGRSTTTRRRIAPLIIAATLIAVTACNEDPTEVDSGPIAGTWVSAGVGGAVFLVITADELVYYSAADADDCADRFVYGLTPLGGNEYQLASRVNPITFESTITQVDDELTWRTANGSAVFQRANEDPSLMDVCAGGGDDPALTCSDLPALQVGQDMPGALAAGDSVERERYYDLYSFQPDMPMTPAEISLTSQAFDSYLYVYDAAGTLIAENDDISADSLHAGLSIPLNPVCYRIEVTTLNTDRTGAYTLRID